jgi:large subunit ribosomal protein L9
MATQVVLLERVESLGNMGDVVSVKPGYARNYLLPQKKALRASKENIAHFEAQKKNLQAENDKKKKAAEKLAGKLDGLKVPLIRAASESGQLYGSVTARDIAAEVSALSKEKIDRSMVRLNQSYKDIGLFPIDLYVHPEVKVVVTINIARSAEEAEIQAKTGRALVSDDSQDSPEPELPEAAQLESLLEDSALEAVKSQADEEAEAESPVRKPRKSAKKTEKNQKEGE